MGCLQPAARPPDTAKCEGIVGPCLDGSTWCGGAYGLWKTSSSSSWYINPTHSLSGRWHYLPSQSWKQTASRGTRAVQIVERGMVVPST